MDVTERIDLYLGEESLDEGISQWINKAISLLDAAKNKSSREFENLCKKNWRRLMGILQAHQLEKDALKIINRHLGSNFRSLDQIENSKIKKMDIKEGDDIIIEDLAHWWRAIKDNSFPALTIFTSLQVCFELDKLLQDTADFGLDRIILYGAMWAFLVSGHYIKSWNKWRKENPKEYRKEKGDKGKGERWRSKPLKTVRAPKLL